MVTQPGFSSVDCSTAPVKFLNSSRELNQQLELEALRLVEGIADWGEWPVQKSNHTGHQVEDEGNGSGSTCSS